MYVQKSNNPLWDKHHFKGSGAVPFYVNRFSRSASLKPPAGVYACRGGILADEMGMGKTIEVLALLLARKDLAARRFIDDRFLTSPLVCRRAPPNPPLPRHSGTLVIAPMSVVGQWAEEVSRFSQPGVLKVLCHYGADRVNTAAALANYDVVVTSYGTLVSEASALGLRPAKTANADDDELPYVVSEERRASGRGGRHKKVLFGVHWERVVMDEAHAIKNRATEVACTTYCISATHRWCLTGTPIQNSLQARRVRAGCCTSRDLTLVLCWVWPGLVLAVSVLAAPTVV